MRSVRILLMDFDCSGELGRTLRSVLEDSLQPELQLRHELPEAQDMARWNSDCTDVISTFHPNIIFSVLPGHLLRHAATLFQSLRKGTSETPILVVVEAGTPHEMFELLKQGVDDFITPPFKTIDILPRMWRLLGQSRGGDSLTRTLKGKLGLEQLAGQSPAFLAEIQKIPSLAKCDASVLILGETGTGKELCARAIHYLSPRTYKPFIPVNCGAIPVELVENELFGHERGAFTGASTRQVGLIEEANEGTLFLDEIDCLPLLAQVKLLRFLQEREYRPLGSTMMRQADVRIISATNVNVPEALENGKLRQDLYYRLNIIPLLLPPLRERQEDIPLLARHFLTKYAAEFCKQVTDISPEAIQILLLHEWPGNVRELEHVMERAIVLSTRAIIGSSDIVLSCSKPAPSEGSFQQVKAKVIVQFERNYIQGLLRTYRGNITKAAQAAQKNRRAFWQLIRKHQIDVQSFRSTA